MSCDVKLKKENLSKNEDIFINPSQPLSQNFISLRNLTFKVLFLIGNKTAIEKSQFFAEWNFHPPVQF